jgi:hypothetical protein
MLKLFLLNGSLRNKGGFNEILNVSRIMEKDYREENELRISGQHETTKYDKFSFRVSNRGFSVRISIETEK